MTILQLIKSKYLNIKAPRECYSFHVKNNDGQILIELLSEHKMTKMVLMFLPRAMMPATPWAAAPAPHSGSSNISTESAMWDNTIFPSRSPHVKLFQDCYKLFRDPEIYGMCRWNKNGGVIEKKINGQFLLQIWLLQQPIFHGLHGDNDGQQGKYGLNT